MEDPLTNMDFTHIYLTFFIKTSAALYDMKIKFYYVYAIWKVYLLY